MKSLCLQVAICWVLFASTANGQNFVNPASNLRPNENLLSLEPLPAIPGITTPEKLEAEPSPPNPIDGKTLRIKIVEGKVGKMRIDGQG